MTNIIRRCGFILVLNCIALVMFGDMCCGGIDEALKAKGDVVATLEKKAAPKSAVVTGMRFKVLDHEGKALVGVKVAVYPLKRFADGVSSGETDEQGLYHLRELKKDQLGKWHYILVGGQPDKKNNKAKGEKKTTDKKPTPIPAKAADVTKTEVLADTKKTTFKGFVIYTFRYENVAALKEIKLEGKLDLSNRVLDTKGKHAADVQVTLWSWQDFSAETGNVKDKEFPVNTGLSFKTKKDGLYHFPLIKKGSYALVASKAGFARTTIEKIPLDKNTVKFPWALSLTPGWKITGTVFDGNKKPVQGVEAVFFETLIDENEDKKEKDKKDDDKKTWPFASHYAEVLTDAKGRFSVADLRPGHQYGIHIHSKKSKVSYKHYNHKKLIKEPKDITISLETNASLTITLNTEGGINDHKVRVELKKDGKKYGNQRHETVKGKKITVKNVNPGSYKVSIRVQGFKVTDEKSLVLKSGEMGALNYTLESGFSIKGRVIDESGVGIAASTVNSYSQGKGNHFRRSREIKTSSDGEFVLSGLVKGQYRLTISHDDYQLSTKNIALDENGRADSDNIEITLKNGLKITGHIYDQNGEPLKGSRVSVKALGMGFGGYMSTNGGHVDQQGKYTITGIKPGKIRLTAREKSHETAFREMTLVVGEIYADIDFTLSSGLEIRGRVMHGAEPVEKANVNAALDGAMWGGERDNHHAKTDKEGYFTLKGLRPKAYRVSVNKTGYANTDYREQIKISAPAEDVVLELKQFPAITGTVVDETGETVATGKVGVVGVQSNGSWWGENDVKEGKFSFSPKRKGTFVLVATAEGFGNYRSEPFEVSMEMDALTMDVVLSKGVSIRGLVQDDTGQVIEGAAISLNPIQYYQLKNTRKLKNRSDAIGAFELKNVGKGKHTLYVAHKDYPLFSKTVTIDANGLDDVLVEFVSGGKLEGSVLDEHGEPLEGVMLYVSYQSNRGSNKQGKSNGKGLFSIVGLKQGNVTVTAMKGRKNLGFKKTIVKVGETVSVDFRKKEANFTVEGKITKNGEVIESGMVMLTLVVKSLKPREPVLPIYDRFSKGVYTLKLSQAGSYNLMIIQGRGQQYMHPKPVIVENEFTQADVEMGGIGFIGRIMDQEGRALANGTFQATPVIKPGVITGSPLSMFGGNGQSNSEGKFDVQGLKEGDYKITVSAHGYAKKEMTGSVTAGASTDLGDVVLIKGFKLSGQCRTQVEGAITGQVKVYGEDKARPLAYGYMNNGYYSVDGLRGENLTVVFSPANHLVKIQVLSMVKDTKLDVDFLAGASVAVTVRDKDGAIVKDCALSIKQTGIALGQTRRFWHGDSTPAGDESGVVTLSSLFHGEQTITATHATKGKVEQTITVQSGSKQNIALTLVPPPTKPVTPPPKDDEPKEDEK